MSVFKKIMLAWLMASGLNGYASAKENDWARDKLSGQVKAYTEISHKAGERSGKIEEDRREREYDSDGYRIQKKYNHRGNLTEHGFYDSDGKLRGKQIYHYDPQGNRIELNAYDSSGNLREKWIARYDDNGKRIEDSCYDSDGNFNVKDVYRYDEQGNQIATDHYDSDGLLLHKETSKYDKQGNRVEDSHYRPDGSLLEKWTYRYNAEGNLIEKYVDYSDDRKNEKWTYRYDSQGNQIEENHYESGRGVFTRWIDQYEYDAQGNWIKNVRSSQTKWVESAKENEVNNSSAYPIYIAEREYEYY